MKWKEKVTAEKLKRLLPFFFLIWGLVSVFTLQRDFAHITRLSIFVLLVGPAFLGFAFLTRYFDRLPDDSRWQKYKNIARQANLSATQTITQYILIFCLPFYVIRENWLYLGINILWLATILWDPIYEKLVQSTIYRHLVLSWALVSASSFLYPFVLPNHLDLFYPALAVMSFLAFIPTRREKKYVVLLAFLWVMTLIPLLIVSPAYRVPILSVWARKPHFAWDARGNYGQGEAAPDALAKTISQDFLKDYIAEGHRLCCVAPVVAPPKVSTSVRQEWSIGDRVIESTELKTKIKGNVAQEAFHSYFCKRNIQLPESEEKLRCRVMIGDAIDIGGTSIILTP